MCYRNKSVMPSSRDFISFWPMSFLARSEAANMSFGSSVWPKSSPSQNFWLGHFLVASSLLTLLNQLNNYKQPNSSPCTDRECHPDAISDEGFILALQAVFLYSAGPESEKFSGYVDAVSRFSFCAE
jgi:hypothetical protein